MKKTSVVKHERVYTLKAADNCDHENQRMYATVETKPMLQNGKPVTSGDTVIEVYVSPTDFVNELTSALKFQIEDEMLDRGLMPDMKISLSIEYDHAENVD